jgi:hypothetical protein
MSWQRATVAPSRTHHLLDDTPLYSMRFDDVFSFHEPGLAAVKAGTEAFHVRADGSAAYARRFLRTFGFYEGIATVVSSDGWHHIRPDGSDLTSERFAWCGNYQERLCAVRTTRDRYVHIDRDGRAVHRVEWRYAGDFREGAAVVQGDDGLSTHVDRDGALLHGVWFLDLDVFHKGFARARGVDGWVHIDRTGRPICMRRFAMIEPFYNGHARVETLEAQTLEVINESAETVLVLRPGRDAVVAR